METTERLIKREGAIYGAVLGVVLLSLFTLQCYLIVGFNASLFVIAIVVPIGLVFLGPIGTTIFLCTKLRKKIGGYWSLRQATTGFFIMFMVSYLVVNLGKVALFKVVDTGLNDKLRQSYIKANIIAWQDRHYKEQDIEKRVNEIQQTDYSSMQGITWKALAPYIAFSVIILFVLALVFAAFFKRETATVLYADGEADRIGNL